MLNVYEQRIAKLREKFDAAGIDGLYVTNAYNVSYLTGKSGKGCSLWITKTRATIITDFRYREMAQSLSHLSYFETTLTRPFTELFRSCPCQVIGIEREALSLDAYLRMRDALPEKTLVPVSGLVETLRMIKDEDEQAKIAAAEKLGDDAFMHMLSFIKAGQTEAEVAAELEYYMRAHGAEGLSFSTIAVSGPNSSMPHGIPGTRKLQKGDFLTLDFGCVLQNYCSDMTRTVAIGEPTEEMRRVYDIVLRAQLHACEQIHAGLSGIQCDAFARDIIAAAGYGEYFGHGMGHGLGLQVHESPRFNTVWADPIPENTVLSIEPGIYLPGRFGVRIEDLCIVKKDGIMNLACAPKELIVL